LRHTKQQSSQKGERSLTFEQLKTILETNKAYTIRQKIFELGYMDATTHPSLKEASLVDIVNGYEKMQVTHEHKGNQWIGYVFIDVKNFEQYEWLWIEFAGRSDKVSSKVYIFAKKAH